MPLASRIHTVVQDLLNQSNEERIDRQLGRHIEPHASPGEFHHNEQAVRGTLKVQEVLRGRLLPFRLPDCAWRGEEPSSGRNSSNKLIPLESDRTGWLHLPPDRSDAGEWIDMLPKWQIVQIVAGSMTLVCGMLPAQSRRIEDLAVGRWLCGAEHRS